MKKIMSLLFLFIVLTAKSFTEDFRLPKVENNVESIKTAFRALLGNIDVIGFVESDSSWTYSAKTISERYKEHIDELLIDMSYNNIKQYVEKIDLAIKSLDYDNMTQREVTSFNNFLNNPDEFYVRYSDKELEDIWKEIEKFQTWKDYFSGKTNIIAAFLFDANTIKNLYEMVNQDIPKKSVPEYTQKLDSFLLAWGISK
ncbi:MAG: hypothetical protein ACTTJ1_06955 [Treponema sp.]